MKNPATLVGTVAVILLVLNGCGVDGPPERPGAAVAQDTGVRLSGHAVIGGKFGL